MQIIVPQTMAEQVDPRVRKIAPDAQIVHIDQDGTTDGDLSGADVLLRPMSKPAFRKALIEAPNLRWVHTNSAGIDGVVVPELENRDLVLTNSAGAHAIAISEFVLAMMLEHTKQLRALAALTPENAWEEGRTMHLGELNGTTALVLGLGNIGGEVARRAAAFGVRVVGNRRHPKPMEFVDQVVGEDGWRDLLPEADFLIICTPLTKATEGLVDADAFARIKDGAYLINIARGQIVDTDAMLAALRSGKLGGAALDALPTEPLPADHPLWQEPNVFITPHISWSSPRTQGRSLEIFFENLKRYVRGETLVNIANIEAGY